ncbi:DNA topoisomerase 2 isoform X2 [Triticum aestivum]|uniref:DNA topoisomerase 2 isoform X2 n=1 Tax=Triticum aestivum TaxID=4565 RepID=UPI001D0121B4|nr:DNA topoisomerase 2-like isoform X2 [Triticum aestivum]
MLEFFQKKLNQVDNRARFLSGVLSGDIKIIPRKQKDLLQEIAEKGFDTLPKEVLPAAVGATIYREENGRSPDVHASDYDYLTSMTISALNEGYLEHLLELKKRFETKVGLLRRATPECLKSAKKRTITLDIQLLDANYIKAQSDRKVVIVIDCKRCKHNNAFEAAPRTHHKRTAAEYLEASVVLMDDDEDHLAGSLEAQEFSETENTQKQQSKEAEETKKEAEERRKQNRSNTLHYRKTALPRRPPSAYFELCRQPRPGRWRILAVGLPRAKPTAPVGIKLSSAQLRTRRQQPSA